MAISEIPSDYSASTSPVTVDRNPPQDLEAERSVLGAMLMSKDAIADAVETVRQDDFYRPAHQSIFGAIIELFTRGEPADTITVADSLTRSGDLERVGGGFYLTTLMSSVPTAASASYYAKIVRDRAILRRLVSAGTRIVQWGNEGEGEVDQVVDRAQAEVFEVTSRRTSEDYLPLSDIMDGAVTEIEGIASRSGEMVGVPTGFTDLDQLTHGLHPGQLIILAARPAIGKALSLDTAIPTPSGWTTMGQIQAGDYVLGLTGTPVRVSAATEVLAERTCFEVAFSDGSRIVADAQHQWVTQAPGGAPQTHTTVQLEAMASLTDRSLPKSDPLAGQPTELPVPAYALGSWLAEQDCGGLPEPDENDHIEMFISAMVSTRGKLPLAALATQSAPSTHIPRAYLRSTVQDRLDLLAGLLDRSGVVKPDGCVEVSCRSQHLARDVFELLTTFGFHPVVAAEPDFEEPSYRPITLNFTTAESVFRVPAKAFAHKEATRRLPHRGRTVVSITRVASVPVRCIEVDCDDHLYLAGRAMVPTHNSTLGLDIARSASVKHGLTSVIFSLEMSRNEIVMRLLSAEAQIPLHNMRSGNMNDPEWRKIAARQGVLHEAPMFVDDSPNMTMTEIRAKCRRLKQAHDLRLVVVDYMQLMSSGKKVESRQQEVSEFSRSMKLLAKELEVPVIAISQLNRGPETRNDKKPLLSDLRESGCLTADTRVIRADTNAEVTLGELHAQGAKDTPVWSLDDSLRYRARTMTHVFATGHREVFKLRTSSGRALQLTANHPLLTYRGWKSVGDLAVGARVAVPRHIPAPVCTDSMQDHELTLLAHLVGDGSFARRQSIRYASTSEDNLAAVAEATRELFDTEPIRNEYAAACATTLRLLAPHSLARGSRNSIAQWLDQWSLLGLSCHEKFIPEVVHGLEKVQIAHFLRHLWATDGCICACKSSGAQIYYSTTSRALADGVVRLLLRFGINARISLARNSGYRARHHVTVSGVADQTVFLRRIGAFGPKVAGAAEALAALRGVKTKTDVDSAPVEVWEDVRSLMAEQGVTTRKFQAQMGNQYGGSTLYKNTSSRTRLERIAEVLDIADLEILATNDVLWDEIVEIESLGTQDVFDATVLGNHNFIANGVAVHNSLEQDADMVILIHREDAYDKDSSRVGEADLIVAKHRNGPTDTVTVSFQGHYSRFVDMARE